MTNTKIGHKIDANGIQFISLSDIPMLDWDWPNEGHKVEECVTITNLKQVVDVLTEYVKKHPSQSIRVYVTPGGVRAFFLGESLSPEDFFCNKGGEELSADPLYIKLCKKFDVFPARVSPKPNRKGDFVASYCCTIGTQPNPERLNTLIKVHDNPIKKFRRKSVAVTYNW